MRISPRQWVATGCLCLMAAAVVGPLSAQHPAEESNGLSEYYGFQGLEIFKFKSRSSNLVAGDFNHDGLTDLVLVDNSNSRIDLLLQRKNPPANAPRQVDPKVNEFEHDWRFEHKKLPVDKSISSLATGDFNGDGRADLAFLGQPDRLIVQFQTPTGVWKQDQNIRLPEPQSGAWTVSAGDLNHDGLDDIAVLGKNETFLLYQQQGKFGTPERVMNTSDKLGLLHVGDLDGDGRNDLCYLANDETGKALCARLQSGTGRIGAELRFELDKPRGTTLKNIDGKPGLEILSIAGQTGRLKVLQVRRPEAQAGEMAGQLVQYGFGGTGARDRDLAVGDLTGDGLADVLVTDPEGAQLILYQQIPGVGLDQGQTYPGLFGTNQVRIVDLNGDNQNEVVVLSTKEKTIGVSRMENGRLTFPQPLPLSVPDQTDAAAAARREPVLLAVLDLDGNRLPEIAFLTRDRTPSKTTYTLRGIRLTEAATAEWKWEPYTFGMASDITVNLKADPEALVPFDADGDQRIDLLAFQGNDRPVIFLKANDKAGFTETAADGGIGLSNLGSGNVFVQPGAEPGLLVAQHNFARRLRLNQQNQWHVLDQFTVSEAKTNVTGVAALNLDAQPGDEIVLVDQGQQRLRVLRAEEQVYRPWREVELGGFPFRRTHVADSNGDGLDDLLLFGANRFGVLYANQTDPRLNELASFESPLQDAFLVDVVAGDLNNDQRIDLAVMEARKHRIEILDYSAELGLRHALAFTVFESKSFQDSENTSIEPREAVIADVTGDGRADLILLAHDRVLLYPQDPGDTTHPPTAAAGN